jgi:hypothetical protein
VAGYSTAGVDYGQLNLTGPLTLAGDTANLLLNLNGLSSAGTATGIVLYTSAINVFNTVQLVNNTGNFSVSLTYAGTGLNATFSDAAAPESAGPVPATKSFALSGATRTGLADRWGSGGFGIGFPVEPRQVGPALLALAIDQQDCDQLLVEGLPGHRPSLRGGPSLRATTHSRTA